MCNANPVALRQRHVILCFNAGFQREAGARAHFRSGMSGTQDAPKCKRAPGKGDASVPP